ncbi:MAG: hypothetical protein CV087_24255 [Candidatus Brocadia sp. WS118]|nr:MAG: hypothetical protein CV087_24255 [Candidatus Brocadia sp. WS118]
MQIFISLNLFADSLSIDSLRAKNNSSVTQKVDTVYIPVPSDSLIINVKSREYPEQTWWDRNQSVIGSTIGAFLAALIAIYTVWRTFKNTKEIEANKNKSRRIEKEKTYCGLLFMIYGELHEHNKKNYILRKAIPIFTETVDKSEGIPYHDPFDNAKYGVTFIEACRIKILDFDFSNASLMTSISSYLHETQQLNHSLNLSPLIRVYEKYPPDVLIQKFHKSFEVVTKMIDILEKRREEIRIEILAEIKSFPHINVDELLQKHNIQQNK